jgi:poly(beta-D-mannuronate) lyase
VINDNRNDADKDYTLIHHNYFADRVPVGEFNALNDQDAIRIGNSSTSLSNSFTEVYANYFNNWSGEIEIISNKSGSNKYYGNTFRDYQGCLTLRHGDNNDVYGNFFFANNNNTTAGIRVIGENQRIYNNYIEGINSRKEGGSLSGATGGINVSNGRQNSALNGYLQVKNTLFVNNTLVNCDYAIRVGTKVSSDLSLPPENLTIANNIILSASSSAISETTSPIGMSTYECNIAQNSNWDITTGTNGNIQVTDGLLAQDDLFYKIKQNSPAIDASTGTFPFISEDLTGGLRTAPNDAGAEELSSGGNIRPYINADVGVSVGFIELTQDLTITQNETSSTDLIIENLTVNDGITLTIAEGHTLTVQGDLTVTGELIIESGATFINYSGNKNDNVTIKRSTRYANGRYSFVGIPINEKNGLDGLDLPAQVYTYDETVPYGNDGINRWINALTQQLKVGVGYAQAFQKELVFDGTPNNGAITVSGLTHSGSTNNPEENGWNLVSNPYPAAISVTKFLG